jgi:hypothetical protein
MFPCAGSGAHYILAHPPLIARDPDETSYLFLSADGETWGDREKVLKVARLIARNQYGRYDQVLVLTDEVSYLMQGEDFDRQMKLAEVALRAESEADDA